MEEQQQDLFLFSCGEELQQGLVGMLSAGDRAGGYDARDQRMHNQINK